jgi:hypothetical protein
MHKSPFLHVHVCSRDPAGLDGPDLLLCTSSINFNYSSLLL